MPEPTCHIPVMLDEAIEWLTPAPGKVLVDGTLGGGGHTAALAKLVEPGGRVLAIDLDPEAIDRCESIVESLPVDLAIGSYTKIPELLKSYEIDHVDGILLDIGLSSDQLADEQRGFSYQSTGTLDLRFDRSRGEAAWQLLARLDERNLANIIYQYGEERLSRRIARRIVAQRRESPIRTANQLADLVRSCVPRSRGHSIDPATRTFQALRIAVNQELASLEQALERLPDCLGPGGRLAIISFHSLEDRLVKHAFRNDQRLEVLTKRPLRPSEAEIDQNPRARSAKMRIAKRTH
ncbi:MAG: 16S rRNA (cytosine(1402)-N(4))-methyltransferase RsmH [Planctomycetes bacterium]|nr:16S rRNA (cytosine(1402)-N(4))-methyltransferase RsmH [Planctomycetota bacterium]